MPGRVSGALSARHPPRPVRDSSFLAVGAVFTGSQTVTTAAASPAKASDEWRVNVTVQGVSLERGIICGSMEALDVPRAQSPVLTFWRGQIIDNRNHFFATNDWKAKFEDDLEHWSEFRAFEHIKKDVTSGRADDLDLSTSRHIFMRWKEIFFVSPGEDCGLTIAGFYYVVMDRQTGAIAGYYFDPNNQPWQRLELNAEPNPNGFSFADYQFN